MSFFFFLISSLKISRCFERNLSSPSGMMHLLVWPVVILGAISSSVPALVSCRACWMTLLFSPFSLCYFHRASVSWLGEKFIWLGSSRTSLCLYKVTFDDAFKIPVKRPCKKGDLVTELSALDLTLMSARVYMGWIWFTIVLTLCKACVKSHEDLVAPSYFWVRLE